MSSVPTASGSKQRKLVVVFLIDGTSYTVSPLACDPDIGDRAVRFHKQGGDGAVYDLPTAGTGAPVSASGSSGTATVSTPERFRGPGSFSASPTACA